MTRRYPAYQDSGLEWLGEVPAGWEVRPVKAAFQIVGGTTPKSDVPEYWDGEINWVTPADLSNLPTRFIHESARQITEAGLASCGTTLVPPNSIVLSVRAPVGSLAIAGTEVCTNQGCKALVPYEQTHTDFYYFVIEAARAALNVLGRGSTFLELSGDQLANFRVPRPPLPEQTAIAAFLDRETAKIDALVAEQRRLIDLLKEKRQAVISHAVTRGLNPHAKLKPSGVDWLGDVPEGWDVVPLKRFISMQSGDAITSERIEVEGAFPVYGGNGLRGSTDTYTHEGAYLLIGRQGALCGNVNRASGRFWASEHAVVVTPRRETDIEWLHAALLAMKLNQYSTSAAQPGLSVEVISQLYLAFPPLAEQIAIGRYLDSALDKLDSLSVTAEAAITLLQERRAALISAAVTGKIDVRDIVPQATEAA